jgi:hypothetical protein
LYLSIQATIEYRHEFPKKQPNQGNPMVEPTNESFPFTRTVYARAWNGRRKKEKKKLSHT